MHVRLQQLEFEKSGRGLKVLRAVEDELEAFIAAGGSSRKVKVGCQYMC